jgi:parallel beta-helix repeat protein
LSRVLRKFIAFASLTCLVSISLQIMSVTSEASTPATYTPHGPIAITGDSGFNASNGVVSGTGTDADPYLIKGWEIGGSPTTDYAIAISRTRAHFTITQVHLMESSKGLYMHNVTHGRVDHSLIENETVGVAVFDCDTCAIVYNTIRDCEIGVLLSSSTNIRLDSNSYRDNTINEQKPSLPWEQTWLGRGICIAVLIPLIAILGAALYFRFFQKKKPDP